MAAHYAKTLKEQGRGRGQPLLFDESRRLLAGCCRKLETCGKPWVAAINGAVPGRRASNWRWPATTASWPTIPKTRVGLPEVKVGLFPGAGGTQRVPRLMPTEDALQMLFKGEQLDAAKAKALGLVHEVVPRGELVEARQGWIKGGGKAVAPWDEKGFKLPGGPVYLAGRHDDLPGRPTPSTAARPTTTIRRRAPSCMRLRRPAVADGRGAARRDPLLRQDPAHARKRRR